ncbi:MAG: hypothetical protein EB084_02220 [Proteobacteria bacterium]|nr:hypothetical protein [Pseudomonadota bacterium]
MRDPEREFMEQIERIIERFGTIQRNFVLDKSGIRAIVKFIGDFAGAPPTFSLDDPVILKGKQAAMRVVEELGVQLDDLQQLSPPERWMRFHASLVSSIELQLKGYQEMTRVFEDSDVAHLSQGQALVNEGMSILEGGTRA